MKKGFYQEGNFRYKNNVIFLILRSLILGSQITEGSQTLAQPVFTCSKLTIVTLEQDAKYVES